MDDRDVPDAIIAQLRRVPVLDAVIDGLTPAQVERLEAGTLWYGLPGGATLFRQGDVGTDVYLLVAGRLGVQVERGGGGRLVHRTRPGELIGEMGLISHEPRTATITAMRDSELLCIPGPLAGELLAASPPFMQFLLLQLVERLRTTTLGDALVAVETIAVVPLDAGAIDDAAARLIERAFAALPQPATVIDQRSGGSIEPDGGAAGLRVVIGRDRQSAWSLQSLRQADRVLFVARAGSDPDGHARALLSRLAQQNRPADLMLVNPAGAARPGGATRWLEPGPGLEPGLFAPDQIFHVHAGDLADHRRVARLAAGQAVGVVLAGGGARGFAHIGALRALEEAGIPVDLIGGTSMGALVGGSVAHDTDLAQVERRVHYSFVLNRPIGDYTLPLVSVSRGRRMTTMLRHHFGEARIENLWRGFFCVSSNLTTGDVQVHRDGLLWRALRASSSLPGIVPPLIERGEVLVDGALMNNFPVDVMRALARGRVIGIDLSAGTTFRSEEAEIEARSLLWMLGPGRRKVPNILKLLMRSSLVASEARSAANRRAADLLIQPELGPIDLLSFDRWAQAIAAGHDGTRRALEALPTPF